MSTVTYEATDPMSSGEIQTGEPERIVDIEQKQRLVSEFLESHDYDALLIQKPGNYSWLTSGADNSRSGSSERTAALFITADARVVVCSNVDSGQIFDHELPGLGFQLKERPWHEPRHILIEDLCRGRTVASDTGFGRTNDVSVHLTGMRNPLSALECERIRQIGRDLSHAVEATARNFKKGQTEAEIAGEVAHRLIKRRVTPERIQIFADGRGQRYRHWTYGPDPVEQYCVISAVGRRYGLCCGISRTVSLGDPPKEIRSAHHRTVLMQATGMYFSKPDWALDETWSRVERIYEKFGFPDEWQYAEQAEIIGYEPCEVPVVPKSEFQLSPRMAVYWHPSIGPALTGDTILVGEKGFELLTPVEFWPKLKVDVKGKPIYLPDILCRHE